MKIWRRGKLEVDALDLLRGSSAIIKPVKDMVGNITKYDFTIEESDPAWTLVRSAFPSAHYFVSTEFSRSEILSSQYLMLYPDMFLPVAFDAMNGWSHDGGFENHCEECGSGWHRSRPYVFPCDPPMRFKGIFGLEGGFTTFFSKSIERDVLNLIGYNSNPVINRNGNELQSVRELSPKETADPCVMESLAEREIYKKNLCATCHNEWHKHYTRGMLPVAKRAFREVDVQWSREWWGNGRTAWKMLIISNRLATSLISNKVRWYDLRPLNVI